MVVAVALEVVGGLVFVKVQLSESHMRTEDLVIGVIFTICCAGSVVLHWRKLKALRRVKLRQTEYDALFEAGAKVATEYRRYRAPIVLRLLNVGTGFINSILFFSMLTMIPKVFENPLPTNTTDMYLSLLGRVLSLLALCILGYVMSFILVGGYYRYVKFGER